MILKFYLKTQHSVNLLKLWFNDLLVKQVRLATIINQIHRININLILFFKVNPMAQNYDEIFKIIFVGDANVGKTNIVSRIVKSNQNLGQKNIAPTIGVQFASKLKKLSDGKIIKCQIWDTAGQEQYRSMTMAHYRKALGALVVYDITKQKSFENIKRWISMIKEQADKNVVIILVANKCDLRDQQAVTNSQGQKLAKQQGVFFSQTSASRNENIEQTFVTLVQGKDLDKQEINKRRKEQGQNMVESQTFSLIRKEKENDHCEC